MSIIRLLLKSIKKSIKLNYNTYMTKAKSEPKVYKIGKVTLPGNFQTGILMRFMSEASMKSLFEDYNGAKMKEHASKEPTEEQFAVAKFYKKDQNRKAAAKKFSMTEAHVTQAVRKVAVWDFLNS